MKNDSELPSDYYYKPVPDFAGAGKPIGFTSDLPSASMRERGVVFEVDCSDLQSQTESATSRVVHS